MNPNLAKATIGKQETRNCQNCKQNFIIEPEDFDFYKKIDVPPPTFCPECRMQRRFTFRNELSLHRNKCALTGKDLISCFATDSGVVVYDRDIWWGDGWDPMQFGQKYDFTKTFFDQFRELMERVPMPAVFNGRTVNSNYGNHLGEIKNGYLISASWGGENIAYVNRTNYCRESLDLFIVSNSEFGYEDVASDKLYQTFFSDSSEGCNNSAFLYDCRGCSNCFGCTNLRNKQYYIWNEPYSKEEYIEKLKGLDIGSHKNLEGAREKFSELKLKSLRKFANILSSKNVTGDNIVSATNCQNCFGVFGDTRDSKFVANCGIKMADSYDGYGVGVSSDLLYENVDVGLQGSRMFFDVVVWGSTNVQYSINCHNCENCFGCIGLRKKSYCVFNTQYSKEEYGELLLRIMKQMNEMPYVDKKNRVYKYGEFFPTELSPFAYNETVAQDYFHSSKKEIEARGWFWRELESSPYQVTIKTPDLPDHIKDVNDEILKVVIGCESCGRAYRFIKLELDFLKRFNIALPHLCFECRHHKRFKQVNLPKLYHRKCVCDYQIYKNSVEHSHHSEGRCPNEFETTYAPDRKEIVYCEACYNAEVV